MEFFVDKHSVVRKIWGKGDTILFIFAGAAAEFALSKAVDWLYFTGQLPTDPLRRLFSTVSYARSIVFSEKQASNKTIDAMRHIHEQVESRRGYRIPEWAYRDVLYMLVDYSIRSYEVMERKLTEDEKEEVFNVFLRLGNRMNISDLPQDHASWLKAREKHMEANLAHSHYTADLFRQYRKHLGTIRYRILLESQVLVAPDRVKELLGFRSISLLSPLLGFYKLCRRFKAEWMLKDLILPGEFKQEIAELDREPDTL